MFGRLDENQIDAAIEALLFVTDEPANVITLADMLETDPSSVQESLSRIRDRRAAEGSGIQLQELAGGWRLYTHPAYHELLERYVLSWDTRRLTQAALETLAIVAYGQPITRQGISAIRGVNSDSTVSSLIEKGLVRESGQADAPGNPMTYSTTRSFLEKFGLRDMSGLPPLADFAPDDETVRYLEESLSAHARFALSDAGEPPLPDAARLGEGERLDDDAAEAMRAMVANALAESAGVVEKIDFDQLEFEE